MRASTQEFGGALKSARNIEQDTGGPESMAWRGGLESSWLTWQTQLPYLLQGMTALCQVTQLMNLPIIPKPEKPQQQGH